MTPFNIDNFHLIGISYKTAPVEIREKFSFGKEAVAQALPNIRQINGISECVLLSTCNRTELYFVTDEPTNVVCERLNNYILEVSGMDINFLHYFYYRQGIEVIEHLFNVTCGLDSMVLGENQIFRQTKHAYSVSSDLSCTSALFNRLFHQAFRVGKQVRSSTSISEGIVSVSSAAVMLGKKVLGDLRHHNALLIGAGKIGKMCAKQLIDAGIENLYITNRTTQHAVEVAEELSGQIIPFESMREMFDNVDIVITSVTSSEPLITKEHVEKYRHRNNDKPFAIIDLGVPRNVDGNVSSLENIYLFNIDNLQDVTNENHSKRKREGPKAREIIRKKVDEYCAWLRERDVFPVIHSLYEKCENIRLVEINRISNKFDDEILEAIDIVTRRIVRKILHNPTITVRSSESAHDRTRLLESIHELFINEQAN